jgi:hypothetical protein
MKTFILLLSLLSPTIMASPSPTSLEVPKQDDLTSINQSLKVISRSQAFGMWQSRNPSKFISDSDIPKIAFKAFEEARRRGLSIDQSRSIAIVFGNLIRSYQGDSFNGWRSSIGQVYLLFVDDFDQDLGESIFGLLGAIDFGDIADIIAQIIALIQLFI